MVGGPKVESKSIKNCENYTLGKTTKAFSKESMNQREKYPLALIHVNLVEINILSRHNERIALVIIDDYSECKFIFPLREGTGLEI